MCVCVCVCIFFNQIWDVLAIIVSNIFAALSVFSIRDSHHIWIVTGVKGLGGEVHLTCLTRIFTFFRIKNFNFGMTEQKVNKFCPNKAGQNNHKQPFQYSGIQPEEDNKLRSTYLLSYSTSGNNTDFAVLSYILLLNCNCECNCFWVLWLLLTNHRNPFYCWWTLGFPVFAYYTYWFYGISCICLLVNVYTFFSSLYLGINCRVLFSFLYTAKSFQSGWINLPSSKPGSTSSPTIVISLLMILMCTVWPYFPSS